MTNKKAVIAMSGGVDSSVAAGLALEEGYDVTGVNLHLAPSSGGKDTEDAKAVCDRLGIPFESVDMRESFRKLIMEEFAREYYAGRTPNPCVLCNRLIKFGLLSDYAESIGAQTLITGHYARTKFNEATGRYNILKAANADKDQSYVLASLTQKQIQNAYFPLGELDKSQVRGIAESFGLTVSDKKDSQDICFVPDGDYAAIIKELLPNQDIQGNFVMQDGRIIAPHKGISNYTIGQRKGLGVALGFPVFVTAINPITGDVVLGSNDDLMKREVSLAGFNPIAVDTSKGPITMSCTARIRYHAKEAPCTAELHEDGKAQLTFDEPQRAPTPGQTCVLYDGDSVIGGGTIVLEDSNG